MNISLAKHFLRAYIINSQINIAEHWWPNQDQLLTQIEEYISLCTKDAHSLEGEPESNHLIPKFLLRDFEGEADGYPKRLRVVRYTISSKRKIQIKELSQITSKGFSVENNFYSMDEFVENYENSIFFGVNDKYRLEKLFSVIEGNVAPLIKLRQQKTFYYDEVFDNPYFYPDDLAVSEYNPNVSKDFLNTATGRRIALAVFFAMQYLRSYLVYKHVMNGAVKQEDSIGNELLQNKNFPAFVEYMLSEVAMYFYSRAWRWSYSSFDNIMPGGTSVIPIFETYKKEYNLGLENRLIMPLGRNATIYFLEVNSFFRGHDLVSTSDSLGLLNWNISKLTKAIAFDMTIAPNKEKVREARICMHPETNLEYLFRNANEKDLHMENQLRLLLEVGDPVTDSVDFLRELPRGLK